MKIKHNCQICQERAKRCENWVNIYKDRAKYYEDEAKYYEDEAKKYSDKCQCEEDLK